MIEFLRILLDNISMKNKRINFFGNYKELNLKYN